MNSHLNSRMIIFPAMVMLVIASLFSLSGCKEDDKGDGKGETQRINYDSVKPHLLPIREAVKYTAYFRKAMDSLHLCMKDNLFPKAEAFNSDALAILLQQKDSTGAPAAGVRIYYGRLPDGTVHMILVPYDKSGNDMITPLAPAKPKEKDVPGVSSPKALVLDAPPGQTIEQGQWCPTVCDNGGSGLGGHN
jgi:hypothetical protein